MNLIQVGNSIINLEQMASAELYAPVSKFDTFIRDADKAVEFGVVLHMTPPDGGEFDSSGLNIYFRGEEAEALRTFFTANKAGGAILHVLAPASQPSIPVAPESRNCYVCNKPLPVAALNSGVHSDCAEWAEDEAAGRERGRTLAARADIRE